MPRGEEPVNRRCEPIAPWQNWPVADEQSRELERIWHTTGRLEDGAAWVRARIRSGSLAIERVELAAWVGSPLAGAVCEGRGPQGRIPPEWAWPAYVALGPAAPAIPDREAIGIAADIVERVLGRVQGGTGRLLHALEAVRAWLADEVSIEEVVAARLALGGARVVGLGQGGRWIRSGIHSLAGAAVDLAGGGVNVRNLTSGAVADAANAVRWAAGGAADAADYVSERAWQDRFVGACLIEVERPDWRTFV